MNLFTAVEVINGGQIMFSSAKFWDAQLRAGHRLAAIGGSDSHNATNPPGPPGSIGWPTTVIEADELSVPAILNGIRAGRTFVDLTASHDKQVDFEAESGGAHARMGETLQHRRRGGNIRVRIHTAACAGSVVHLLLDGEEVAAAPPMPVDGASAPVEATINVGCRPPLAARRGSRRQGQPAVDEQPALYQLSRLINSSARRILLFRKESTARVSSLRELQDQPTKKRSLRPSATRAREGLR